MRTRESHRKCHRKVTTHIWSTFFGLACRRLSSSEGAPAGFREIFCAKPWSRGRCQAQERRTPAAVPTAVGVQKTETWLGPPKHNYRQYITTREIPTSRCGRSALFTMCYADAHAAIMEPSCTELPRGPWDTGDVWRVMTVRSVRSWAPRRHCCRHATCPTTRPRPKALSHRMTYTPCRAAMAPWLLCYPRCPKRAQQFHLIKLYLASHPVQQLQQSRDGFI